MKIIHQNFKGEIIQKAQTAQKSIKIAIAWFTDKDLLEVLCQKANAGVLVQVILGDDSKNFDQFYSLDFDQLSQSGGKWTSYVSPDGFMHLKLCLIDDNYVFTGTSNYTKNGFHKNKEINYLIEDKTLIEQHSREFSMLWQEAYQIEEGIIIHPEKNLLKFKIELLYQQISYLETAIAYSEKQISTYELEYRVRFRDKIEYILKKRTQLAAKKASENPNFDNIQQHQESENFYQEFQSARLEDQVKLEKNTDATLQQKLKALFREAVKLCHPDSQHLQEKHREKANKVFDAVKKAMDANDLEQLEQLLEDIKSGLAFDAPAFETLSQDTIHQYLQRLEQKHNQLCEQLELLQQDERFQIIESGNYEEHFTNIEKQLDEEIKILNRLVDLE